MVDVVAAKAGADQLLEQLGLFVAALGAAKAGNIDNTTVNGMLSYALGGHKVSDTEQVLTATFDLDKVEENRMSWGVFRDRRPEWYGEITRQGRGV